MEKIAAFSGDMGWASNMYPAPITFDDTKHNLREIYKQFKFDGLEYPTSEHLYQSLKATNEEDKELIRTAPTPKLAKKYGSQIFSRMDWDSVKVDAMRLTLYLKFYQHPNLLMELINTGRKELKEVNWWNDKFWGVSDKTFEGENWLGRLLMELRAHSKLLLRLESE
jgi:ribA/ribD-fused uncharacterized protein